MPAQTTKISAAQLIFSIVYIAFWPALLFFLSGDWHWTEGWIFAAWFIGICAGSQAYLSIKDPALLRERFRKPGTGNQKKWDKYFLYLTGVAFLAWMVIMPLDAKKYAWSFPFPLWCKGLGIILLLLSAFFLFRSFTDNTFLSPLVRIQTERKQTVISTGVYGFVRHPMYLGAVLLFAGTPLLLGSLYGLIIGALVVVLITFRIRGEEKMLVNELEGYTEYQNKVRYRLIPFVW